MARAEEPRISVLIPCYNEESTIGKVIDDFRRQLPSAEIFVFDNCSTDGTARIAAEHGATVLKEPRRGKGYVVDGMFARVDSDIYVMVDGDDTYPAGEVHRLIGPILAGDADMVVGARLQKHTDDSFRPLHVLGNNLVRRLVNWVAHASLTDIMSGYRAFHRRVVEKIPVISPGFEVETEMTIQMLYHRLKVIEIQVPYMQRQKGSESKLRTFRDGLRILWKIFSLFRAFKPLTFFGSVGMVFLLLGLLAGILPVRDYITNPNHYVEHVPSAILAASLVVLSFIFIFLGILLHAINWRFLELHSVLTRSHRKH